MPEILIATPRPRTALTDKFARIITPRNHTPAPPLDSHSIIEEGAELSFQQLLGSALRVHEELCTQTSCLQAENQRLQIELARIKQNPSLLGVTPRPESDLTSSAPQSVTQDAEKVGHDSNAISRAEARVNPTKNSPGLFPRSESYSNYLSPLDEEGHDSQDLCSAGKAEKDVCHSNITHEREDFTTKRADSDVHPFNRRTQSASNKSIQIKSSSRSSLAASESQKEHAKKMHQIRLKFKRLDCDGRGKIPSHHLEEMFSLDQKKLASRNSTKDSSELSNMDQTTFSDVIKAVSAFNGKEETTMTYTTFVTIMTKEDLHEYFDAEVCEKINQIRAMFARDDMTKAVARYANLQTCDLSTIPAGHQNESPLRFLDRASIVAISLNALMLGVSCDVHDDWTGWDVAEYLFTLFFLLELLVKSRILGMKQFCCGGDAMWNLFDLVILIIALIDAVLSIFILSDTSNIQLFTLARLVRLARITRLVRLLRFKAFKELLLMIRGVFAGMRTLFWAMVVLSMLIFMLGMLMRQTMGRWCILQKTNAENLNACVEDHLQEHGEQLFSTFPRSCLTVFRCFTDGCTAPGGTPLLMHLYDDSTYGRVLVCIFVMSFLFVTFGLFNLIMAIFVENTMEAAKNDERKRKKLRQMQAIHVARQLQSLLLEVCKVGSSGTNLGAERTELSDYSGICGPIRYALDTFRGKAPTPSNESELTPIGLNVEMSRDVFARIFADPHVEKLLEDLQLTVTDPVDLFDVLDADGSGSIDVSELIKGILKLRGTADKSDVVACLLAVRAMQKSFSSFQSRVIQSQNDMLESQSNVDLQVWVLDQCLQEVVPGYREQFTVLQSKLSEEQPRRPSLVSEASLPSLLSRRPSLASQSSAMSAKSLLA